MRSTRPRHAPTWAIALIAALGFLALVAPFVAPFAPDAVDLASRRAAPSVAHWFGTDALGRDVLSRVLYGARVSLAVGVLSAALAVSLGAAIGALGGYVGHSIDALLMRLTDAMLSVPRLPLLMVLGAILQPSIAILVVMVGIVGWMETARVTRAEVLSIRERPYIEATRAAGARVSRQIVRHVMPNVLSPLAVAATLAVGRGILLESTLSFFGVGVQPPTASWGNMLYQAQSTMTTAPWLALFPGLMIFATVAAINSLGEQLAHG
ncbi:MAG: ABC transporter permease [Gemmatimonadaceae bacterium]